MLRRFHWFHSSRGASSPRETSKSGEASPHSNKSENAGGTEAMTDRESLMRWRLVLGAGAGDALGCGLDGEAAGRDRLLGFLYDREYDAGRNVRGTGAGGQ